MTFAVGEIQNGVEKSLSQFFLRHRVRQLV